MPDNLMRLMYLRVEYAYDLESQNWSFRVPSLGIVGGTARREEAEQAAIEAVAYALEDEQETADPTEAEVRYLQLAVQPYVGTAGAGEEESNVHDA